MRFFAKLYVAALLLLFLILAASALNLDEQLLTFYRGCYFPPCYTAN